jgi:hypothetical protein
MKKTKNSVMKVKQRRTEMVRRKEKYEYDPDPPRCENCIHKRVERIGPKNQPQQIIMYCRHGSFLVKPYAICNNWKDKDGTTLE